MRRVYLETPYAGAVDRNLRYLRACMADCLRRGEAPFASHGLYTQEGVLRDVIPGERDVGMTAGFTWAEVADVSVFYVDCGFSAGMLRGVRHAIKANRPCEVRVLPGWVECPAPQ